MAANNASVKYLRCTTVFKPLIEGIVEYNFKHTLFFYHESTV